MERIDYSVAADAALEDVIERIRICDECARTLKKRGVAKDVPRVIEVMTIFNMLLQVESRLADLVNEGGC